ncbi:FAD binding protein [Opitutaceae bacterium TAV1]|nr:FAD binding protein [Opitutaceae bacterium TAV1]
MLSASIMQTRLSCAEPSRSIPVVADADVIVCGGGPAGVAAALSAARSGARVVLIELQGCLGGVWTAGLLGFIIDGNAEAGVMADILRRIAAWQDGRGPQFCDRPVSAERPRRGVSYSAETMKVALEDLCASAGVRVRLHTRVVAALNDAQGRLTTVITESKNGREAWRARVFVDCTGDGDLAAQAGCAFAFGRDDPEPRTAGPRTGQTQAMTLMGLVTGPDYGQVQHFVTGRVFNNGQGKDALVAEFGRAGFALSYSRPTLFHIHDRLYALMANHAYGYSGIDADDLTAATLASRAEVFSAVRALRRLGGVWAHLELVATGNHIGVREGRRIAGLMTVTREDLINGARYPDAVTHVTFPVDVHATARSPGNGSQGAAANGYSNEGVHARPYDIPFGALVARDVDGLLLAGRCISGDFIAHASYRVTGYSVELGEAAGRAAAWCARRGVSPHKVAWRQIVAEDDPPAGSGSA